MSEYRKSLNRIATRTVVDGLYAGDEIVGGKFFKKVAAAKFTTILNNVKKGKGLLAAKQVSNKVVSSKPVKTIKREVKKHPFSTAAGAGVVGMNVGGSIGYRAGEKDAYE